MTNINQITEFPMTAGGPMTAADWAAADPILGRFQVGIEKDPATGVMTKAKVGDGVTPWNSLPYFNPSGGPKVYRAILTQSGTDAPVATVLENSVGDIEWTYYNVGLYRATLVGAFPQTRTWLSLQNMGWNDFPGGRLMRTSDDVVTLIAGNDDNLEESFPAFIEILVYP